jgi:hypothetical protein
MYLLTVTKTFERRTRTLRVITFPLAKGIQQFWIWSAGRKYYAIYRKLIIIIIIIIMKMRSHATIICKTEKSNHLDLWLLRNHVFYVVVPCGSVIASRRYERTYRVHIQGYSSENWHITLKINAVRSFETSGSNYPTTRRNNPEYLFPQ